MEKEEIKSLCDKYDIRPSKKKGQNFLINKEFVLKAVEAAEIDKKDYVVEIGPGFGILTKVLAEKAQKVLAVELDKTIYQATKELMFENVELLNEDILKVKNSFFEKPYKIVANLPYSITSAVLRKFTEQEPRPELMVVMVQKEVAERVCAKSGEMSILSVAVQYYANPEIVTIVPREDFWPEPAVDSAILKIKIKNTKDKAVDEKRLFQLVRIGFSSRRKQLQNNLAAGLRLEREKIVEKLEQIGLDCKIRAQELSVENWIALSNIV